MRGTGVEPSPFLSKYMYNAARAYMRGSENMDKKIKKYFVDDIDSEVYAISLVDRPAIESNYVHFSKELKGRYVAFDADERRMVAGPVLIPDLPIYRYDDYTGEEYYIVFSAKAIENLSRKFFRVGQEFTQDHERFSPGTYLQESWIKSDMEKDKSVALGLDPSLPNGTWFVTAYIDSEETWTQVKDGKWAGFSVESWLSLVDEKLRKEEKNNGQMKEQTFIEKLKDLFNEYFKEDNKEEAVLSEEKPAEEAEKEELSEEAKPDEGNLSAEAEEQAQQEELAEEPETEEEVTEDRTAELEARIADLEAKLADVLDRLAAANLRSQELEKQNEELSKQPSAKPVNVKASSNKADVMDTIRSLRDGTYFK